MTLPKIYQGLSEDQISQCRALERVSGLQYREFYVRIATESDLGKRDKIMCGLMRQMTKDAHARCKTPARDAA